MQRSKILFFIWGILAGTGLLLLFFTRSHITLQVIRPEQDRVILNKEILSNGFRMDGWNEGAKYMYAAVIQPGLLGPSKLQLIPDDCIVHLWINNKQVDVSSLPRCDWDKGITVSIDKANRFDRKNIILLVQIEDSGGKTGFIIKDTSPFRTGVKVTNMLIWICAICYLFSRKTRSRWVLIIVALGFLVRFVYLDHTPYLVRSHDVEGHVEYINHLVYSAFLPPLQGGWEYYQPPLYYLITSGIYRLVTFVQIGEVYYLLQVFSLFLFAIFLFYSYRILSEHLPNERAVLYSFVVLVFWPSSIIHSVRIGNDILLYVCTAIFLYYLLRFIKGNTNKQRHDFSWASLFCGLSILTKSNGIILFFILVTSVFLFKKRQWLKVHWRYFLIVCICILILASTNFLRIRIENSKADPFVANITTLNSALRVHNSFSNLVTFDVINFIRYPFARPWDDTAGRQQFFTHLWKTSLFGEFSDGEKMVVLVQILATLFIYLSLFFCIGLLVKIKEKGTKDNKTRTLLLFVGSIFLLSVFLGRLRYPYSSTGNFRYMFPFLIPYTYFVGRFVTYAREKKGWLLLFSQSIIVLFASISSIVCILLP